MGSLHALMIAASFLHRMLSAEIKQGAVPHWQGGAETLDIDRLFVLPGAPDAGSGLSSAIVAGE